MLAVSAEVYDLTVRDNPDMASLLMVEGRKAKKKPTAPTTAPKRPDSELETKFLYYWNMSGGPELQRDYVGWTDRKLEIDFYHEPSRLGIEINGGIGKLSGHTSWNGIHRDYEKLMLATQAGIKLVFLGTRHLNDTEALVWVSMLIRMTK